MPCKCSAPCRIPQSPVQTRREGVRREVNPCAPSLAIRQVDGERRVVVLDVTELAGLASRGVVREQPAVDRDLGRTVVSCTFDDTSGAAPE